MMLTQKELVELAERQLSVHEEPMGSNHVVMANGDNLWRSIGLAWADGSADKPGQAWCGAFNYWLDCRAGAKPPYSALTAVSCAQLEAWARENHAWTQDPQVGDIVIYRHGKHQGRVVEVSQWNSGRGHITTVEGNWANRVEKLQRSRDAYESIDGFVRRNYSPASAHSGHDAASAHHATPRHRPPVDRRHRSLVTVLASLLLCGGASTTAGNHRLNDLLSDPQVRTFLQDVQQFESTPPSSP